MEWLSRRVARHVVQHSPAGLLALIFSHGLERYAFRSDFVCIEKCFFIRLIASELGS